MKIPETQIEAIRYFANEDRCIGFVGSMRWPNGVICPTCGRIDVSYLKTQQRWQCKSAHSKRQFSAKTGTIFEDSAVGLDKWLPAVWMIINAKNGVSSYETAKAIGVTQKSAWHMNQRIRKAIEYGTIEKLDDPAEGDEMYAGTKKKRGQPDQKMAVIGVVEKKKGSGQIRTLTTRQADASNTLPFLKQHLKEGAVLHTDESRIYSRAKRTFIHETVNHSIREYARGDVSTNYIEGFWNLFRRSYRGTYTHLSSKHLDRYVQEHTFRYNTRAKSDGQRFLDWFSGCERRLTYKQLVG